MGYLPHRDRPQGLCPIQMLQPVVGEQGGQKTGGGPQKPAPNALQSVSPPRGAPEAREVPHTDMPTSRVPSHSLCQLSMKFHSRTLIRRIPQKPGQEPDARTSRPCAPRCQLHTHPPGWVTAQLTSGFEDPVWDWEPAQLLWAARLSPAPSEVRLRQTDSWWGGWGHQETRPAATAPGTPGTPTQAQAPGNILHSLPASASSPGPATWCPSCCPRGVPGRCDLFRPSCFHCIRLSEVSSPHHPRLSQDVTSNPAPDSPLVRPPHVLRLRAP